MIIIDDSNAHLYTNPDPEIHGRGLIQRDFDRVPLCSMPGTRALDIEIPPRSSWSALIKEGNEKKSFLSHIRELRNIPSQDQNGTNYCWFFGPVSAMTISRAVNHQPFIRFSPTAGAAKIKNYKNIGGWGGEALEYIITNGVPSAEFWPINAIDRKYDTPEMRADALNNRVTEWYDLPPKNFDFLMACLFARIPVAVGYNWWKHEVCALDPVEISPNNFGIKIWNSWSDSWSENGIGILAESKATPDDAVAPLVVTPNAI